MTVVEQEQTVNTLPNKLNENNDDQKDLEFSDVKSKKSHNYLFNDALKCIENEDYDNAVECLANALEIINSEENEINGESIEFAEYYFEYGKALLNLVQQKSNFIALGGDNGNMDYDDYDEDDDDDDDDDNADINNNNSDDKNDVNDNGEQKENVLETMNMDSTLNQNEIAKEEKKENESVDINNNNNNNNDNNNADKINVNAKEEMEENEDDQNEAQNDAEIANSDLLNEDRVSAWENLEISRVLVEKYLNDSEIKKSGIEIEKYTLLLIDIQTYLGQHLLEDDKFNEAMDEFNKALEIIIGLKENQLKNSEHDTNKQIETKYNRLISSIHFWLYLTSNFNEMYHESMKHCQNAIKSLNDRLFFLLSNKLNLDINDVQKKELLNYAKTYLEEHKNNMDGNNNNSIKTELEELVELMGDLVLKLEDCREIVEHQKRNVDNNNEENEDIDMEDHNNSNNNNNNNNDNDLESNPLKAMIAALVSKYGIGAEQLESMDNETEEKEDKSNENTNHLNAVTTIGFGNNNQNNTKEDNDIFELGTFGSSKDKNDQNNNNNNKEYKFNKSRKRKLNETDIELNLPCSKKVKLDSVEETCVPNEQKTSE